ncbi:MAG: hypothetical protein Q8L99_08165 [Polycyclovorans sp.]|nr:hypothetical protein [Polycyclovorans sp.]
MQSLMTVPLSSEEKVRMYEMVKQQAAQEGIPTQNWPAQYDPAWVRMQYHGGIGALEHFKRTTAVPRAAGAVFAVLTPSARGR